MNKTELKGLIRTIGLALHASNNTVATDSLEAEPVEDYSWRIDNSKAIEALDELEKEMFKSS